MRYIQRAMTHLRAALDTALATWDQPAATDQEWASVAKALERESAGFGAISRVSGQLVERRMRRAAHAMPRERMRRQGLRRRLYEVAWSLWTVAEAEDDPADPCGLRAFRRSALGNTPVEAPVEWVARHREGDGPPSVVRGDRTGSQAALLQLFWSGERVRCTVAEGGTLASLRRVAQRLAGRYGWDVAQATTFTLTGIRPAVSAIQEVGSRVDSGPRWRIVLSIDPAMTPDEVAMAYRRARAEVAGHIRHLAAKHLHLAAFTFEHRHLPVQRQLEDWNRQYSAQAGYRYRKRSIFQREAQRARQAVANVPPLRR